MNTFFLDFYTDKTPMDAQNGHAIFDGLDQWSSKGDAELVTQDHFLIGHHSKPSLSQCSSVFAPQFFAETGEWVLFDGRIDNRKQLEKRLGIKADEQLDDLQLFYQFYKSQGIANLREVIGPFVFIIFSAPDSTVVAGRDCMGGRYLAFHQQSNRLIISNSLLTLTVHPKLAFEINDLHLVSLLGFLNEQSPETLMRGSYALKPGHYLIANNQGVSEHCFYLPNPKARIDDATPDELATEYRRLLSQSVQRRIVGCEKVGSMLSGGLDSIPMTVLAAQQMDLPNNLHALTWCFDDYSDSDERQYIQKLPGQYGFTHHAVMCDQVWPDLDQDHCSPVLPMQTPYAGFHLALNTKVKQLGINVVLNGVGGDSMFVGHQSVIYELLCKRRFSDALAEAKSRKQLEQSWWSFIKGHLIKQLPHFHLIEKIVTKRYRPEWLSNDACALLGAPNWISDTANEARRPYQYINLVGMLEGNDQFQARIYDGDSGFEKRQPYRDRDLIEFMLAIPSENLHFNGISRPIVRQAMDNILPNKVKHREDKASFYPVIENRVLQSKKIDSLLSKGDAQWQKWVDHEYLSKDNKKTEYFAMLRWYCGYYQHWVEKCYNLIH